MNSGNKTFFIPKIKDMEGNELAAIEQKIKKQKRESILRIYTGSGAIFLSPQQGKWSFYFGGNFINPNQNKIKPGEAWQPANSTIRLRYIEGFKMLNFLWDAICKQINEKETLYIRIENQNIFLNYIKESQEITLKFTNFELKQATVFHLHEHHILDLYLGMLATYRYQMNGRFSQSDKLKGLPIIKSFPLSNSMISLFIQRDNFVLRHDVINDKIFRGYPPHATMTSHILTSFLYRHINKTGRVGEKIALTLPTITRKKEDHGKIEMGVFEFDFSKANTPILVAIHMACSFLADGLPTHLYR